MKFFLNVPTQEAEANKITGSGQPSADTHAVNTDIAGLQR